MSNNNSPYGFSYLRNQVTASSNFQTAVRQILNTNTHSFGKGDVVKTLPSGGGQGYIDRALTSDSQVLGVFDRCEYYDSTIGAKQFRNAWLAPSGALAGSVIAYVIDDPRSIFQVQSGNGGPVTYASVGNNVNFGGNAAPSTLTGLSIAYADFGTILTTSTLPFRIIDVPQTLGGIPTTAAPINNDSTSLYNTIYVTLNSCDAVTLTGL